MYHQDYIKSNSASKEMGSSSVLITNENKYVTDCPFPITNKVVNYQVSPPYLSKSNKQEYY